MKEEPPATSSSMKVQADGEASEVELRHSLFPRE